MGYGQLKFGGYPMAILKYAEFYQEQLEIKRWKKSEIPAKAKDLGYDLKVEQVYEFMEGKHCPNAGIAALFELIFQVQLGPRSYGFGQSFKAKQ
jgi:hypothetical protein